MVHGIMRGLKVTTSFSVNKSKVTLFFNNPKHYINPFIAKLFLVVNTRAELLVNNFRWKNYACHDDNGGISNRQLYYCKHTSSFCSQQY